MAYKTHKVAKCACGTGEQHSLRQAGICDGLRSGKLDRGQATELLAALSAGNRDDKRRKGEVTNVSTISASTD